jgi:predicted metal-binding membrane protein
MKAILRRDLFLPAIGSLVAVAWLTLWAWERSPYGRYLSHAELGHLAQDGGESSTLVQAGLYVVGWTVMTVAMMLPTAVPLIEIFRRMTRDHTRRAQLVGALVLGYLGIWLAFGIAAHVLDWELHRVVTGPHGFMPGHGCWDLGSCYWPGPFSSRPSSTAASTSVALRSAS